MPRRVSGSSTPCSANASSSASTCFFTSVHLVRFVEGDDRVHGVVHDARCLRERVRNSPETRVVTSMRGRRVRRAESARRRRRDRRRSTRVRRPSARLARWSPRASAPSASPGDDTDLLGYLPSSRGSFLSPLDRSAALRAACSSCDAQRRRRRLPFADVPRRARRDLPRVERVEVPRRRQEVDAAARWRAAPPGGTYSPSSAFAVRGLRHSHRRRGAVLPRR